MDISFDLNFAWYLPFVIFLARIADMSLGTIRTIMIVSGRRWISGLIALVEICVWVLAIGGLVTNLKNFYIILAYTGGFAAGTVLGIYLEEWLALGIRVVRVIHRDPESNLCHQLREHGYRVTRVEGTGRDGAVEIGFAVVKRAVMPRFYRDVEKLAPDAWVTVEPVERASVASISSDVTGRRRSFFNLGMLRK
ncbi:DUF2179 domain-containing protein [Mucisphaera calidilacus]|uniref:Uncharacterized protein n=1 Tax=Mucisphaera calidilacus TaxID=2527982 RepID=A0A518C013_9BACT|nr:DUF5698 domain-containing protein [Mucisphaera calidilacus]QDU72560.1 hypothetical protein Pan265_24300 [Mucisphaera calidilacus]